MKNALKGATGARAGAVLMTAGSLVWTAYGIIDLLGAKGVPVVLTVESLYLTLHYMEAKGLGGKKARRIFWILGWIAAVALGAFLCVHAAYEWGAMAAVPAAIPPLASKLLWLADELLIQAKERLLHDNSVEATPEMVAEHALRVRNADHEARMAEAEADHVTRMAKVRARTAEANIQAEASEEIARLKAEADREVARLKVLSGIAMARTEAGFQVELDRLSKEDEMRVRKPLFVPPAVHELPASTSRELVPTGQATSQVFGFASAIDSGSAPTASAARVQEIRESYALGNGFSIDEIKERYGVGKTQAYALRKEAQK